tara:strand:- start:2693 stop:3538 length:846 start_codon:yes stop_codon:yes gene_type:complete
MNKVFVFRLILLFSLQACKEKNSEIEQDREEVVMRKIGHEILLQSNDSTSLVYPILKEGDTYRIQFSSDFGFQAENFVAIIDSIIKNSHLNESYLVLIEKCDSAEVVYSYEVDVFSPISISAGLACISRPHPKECYEVVIKFFRAKEDKSNFRIVFLLIGIVSLIIGITLFKRKKTKLQLSKGKIKLGDYLYDPKKMVLIRQEKTIELTSKENELLSLLNEFANETVTKETILNKVWGDEGDYVGRTLDVYVSKLRKKLENDSSIEIKNIRGIGYKLIIED